MQFAEKTVILKSHQWVFRKRQVDFLGIY